MKYHTFKKFVPIAMVATTIAVFMLQALAPFSPTLAMHNKANDVNEGNNNNIPLRAQIHSRNTSIERDLSTESAHGQTRIFEELRSQLNVLERLSLTGSSELRESFFKKVGTLTNLSELVLIKCDKITNSIFSTLMSVSPYLKLLNLGENKAITKVATGFFESDPVVFSELETFIVAGCINLEEIRLKAPRLRHLTARKCSKLVNFQHSLPSVLDIVDLMEANSFPLDNFLNLLENYPTLRVTETGGSHLPEMKRPLEREYLRVFIETSRNARGYHSSAWAQYELAEMYAEGKGVVQNQGKARELCSAACGRRVQPGDVIFPLQKDRYRGFIVTEMRVREAEKQKEREREARQEARNVRR